MSKYRKKPVIIEAIPIVYRMEADDWRLLPQWLRDAYEKGDVLFLHDGVEIKTLEGWMMGRIGDLIIQGVKGELYPCKRDIFEMTYEKVDDA